MRRLIGNATHSPPGLVRLLDLSKEVPGSLGSSPTRRNRRSLLDTDTSASTQGSEQKGEEEQTDRFGDLFREHTTGVEGARPLQEIPGTTKGTLDPIY